MGKVEYYLYLQTSCKKILRNQKKNDTTTNK